MTGVSTIELGRVGPPHLPRPPDLRRRLFWLPDQDVIVMPDSRMDGGWRCAVIAAHTPWRISHRPGHLDLSDAQITAAATTLDIGDDLDRFSMLWVARVHQHDPSGVLPHLARRLAEDIRTPATLTVDLGPAAGGWRRLGARPITLVALRLHLDRLHGAGFLATVASDAPSSGWGPYLLALPELARLGGAAP